MQITKSRNYIYLRFLLRLHSLGGNSLLRRLVGRLRSCWLPTVNRYFQNKMSSRPLRGAHKACGLSDIVRMQTLQIKLLARNISSPSTWKFCFREETTISVWLIILAPTSSTFIETCHPSISASGAGFSSAMSACCGGAVFQHVEVHGEFPWRVRDYGFWPLSCLDAQCGCLWA